MATHLGVKFCFRGLRELCHIKNSGSIWKRQHSQFMISNSNILKLHDRGIFQRVFPEGRSADLYKALTSKPQCVYCGFDPTADSLHVGHLLAIVALLHCQRGGHQVIALLGGATAKIGDPSGRSTERTPLDQDTIDYNVESLRNTLQKIFLHHEQHFMKGEARSMKDVMIIDNNEWYNSINVVDFLSTAARNFRLGTMLGRQSVQSRLGSPEGMNFTEFCYQIFQAYDWLHLHRQYGCSIQIGGNDQTGNIMSGHDLVQRMCRKTVFGLTVPLVTSSTGEKLGKTAGNAVWLHPSKTSPFELYQYFVRLPDSAIEGLLKILTFYSDDVIKETLYNHEKHPEQRIAHRRLAEHVTLLVHGERGLTSARRCTEALYQYSGEKLAQLSEEELVVLFKNAPTTQLYPDRAMTVADLVLKAECFSRRVDAERIIKAGGIHINHQRVTNPEESVIQGQHIMSNSISVIRKGKKNYFLIKWNGT